jgi:hypothetical protein
MRRLLLIALALLAGGALATPAAQADPYFPYECHAFVQCTIYAPNGEKVTSYEDIRAVIDELRP